MVGFSRIFPAIQDRVAPVFAARQAKYDLKQSTDGLEGLADIAYNVEDAREDAAQKARAVGVLSCGSWQWLRRNWCPVL